MNLKEKLNKFDNWKERLSAYGMALTLLGVDQTNGAPKMGQEFRMNKTAILQGEYLRVYKDVEMFDIICELMSEPEGSLQEFLEEGGLDEGDIRRELELYHEDLTRDKNIPPEEYMEFSRVLDLSIYEWLRAKEEEDYKGYAPYLQNVIDGYKRITSLKDSPLGLYDRMLDDDQPGWTQERYDRFFSHVKERVVPMVRELGKTESFFTGFMTREYDPDKQRKVMKKVLDLVGFTDEWGRVTESEHPVTSCVSEGDIRFTTKYRLNDPSQAILSSVHESGHGWFGHNVDPRYDGSIIAHTISAGLHESQSRLCENHLGRSRAFWDRVYPWLMEEFSEELKGLSADDFYKEISQPKATLVRTESDELTYPLHILIRYELEKEFIEGDLKATDFESAWSDKYYEYLGIRPDRPSNGILQDMHWPYAYFGYFPTYALGSAMAAQFFEAMKKDIDPDEMIRTGRYPEIMAWLRDHVHRYANRFGADEVLKLATGESFNDEYYFRWLEDRYHIV